MTRFAEALTRTTDNSRVREIREYEAGQVDRDFAPVRAQMARNLEVAKAANKAHSLY
jgi:hypothetical protein